MGLLCTTIEPEQLRTLETWLNESRETSLAANRRRSQRVLMTIPVRVRGQIGGGLLPLVPIANVIRCECF